MFAAAARHFWSPGSQDRLPLSPRVVVAVVGAALFGSSGAVEQTAHGPRPPAHLVVSFDGLGVGFEGPQGTANLRSPSDNTLAVGPTHVVQIVNARMAIFTKQGQVLYGPVETRNVFRGAGGPCEARNNGDAVVRYDQLADRWLIVMPIFSRGPTRGAAGGTPGPAVALYQPPAPPAVTPARPLAPAAALAGRAAEPSGSNAI